MKSHAEIMGCHGVQQHVRPRNISMLPALEKLNVLVRKGFKACSGPVDTHDQAVAIQAE